MRIMLGLLVAAVATILAVPRDDDGLLVVHEWGTFTNFSGSDGVHLEFRPLADNDLPAFVFDRARQAGGIDFNMFLKRETVARTRMETPVTYFYTDRERVVDVSVGFPQGLLTEFYPPVRQMTPDFLWDEVPNLTHSILDWGTLRILPEEQFRALQETAALDGETLTLPESENDDHYAAARETDSAILEFNDTTGEHGKHYEKFLFYRGVGNFQIPLVLAAHGADQYELTNAGADPVRSLFLVDVNGEEIRFSQYDQVGGRAQMAMATPQQTSTIDELAEAVVAALVDEGLFEKEARAMVKTWRGSWFAEPGVRLLYMVPRALTDKLLPIQIEPQPDELVRVLVGRLEVLSPEHEQQIAKLVTDLTAGDEISCKHASTELAKFGRFAEPALERARRTATDEDARRRAEDLIHWIRRQR